MPGLLPYHQIYGDHAIGVMPSVIRASPRDRWPDTPPCLLQGGGVNAGGPKVFFGTCLEIPAQTPEVNVPRPCLHPGSPPSPSLP